MDNRNQIIDRIDAYYNMYLRKQSDVLFNAATDALMEQILSIPCCGEIVERIKKKHPIDTSLLEQNQTQDYYEYISDITKNREYFISYCLHLYDYFRDVKGVKAPGGYDQSCYWLYSNIRGNNDSMQLFKSDFIRPILDYIILQLKSESYVLYLLDRYKQRVERFKTIGDIENKKELDLQRDLYLYLFDQGIEVQNSPDTGNGRIDFLVKCNGADFAIEVKRYTKESGYTGYVSQLQTYMQQYGIAHGCLYIYTKEDVFFSLESLVEGMSVQTVYIGEKTPCERKIENITLRTKS